MVYEFRRYRRHNIKIAALVSVFLSACGGGREELPAPEIKVSTPAEVARRLEQENEQQARQPPGDDEAGDSPSEIRVIRERGYIVYAMTAADQKPFFYIDARTGQFIGLDVELGYEIANRLGVRAVFNRDSASFDSVVQKVINKEADIALSKLSRTMRRAERVRYTNSYIEFRQALLVNRLEFAKIGPEENLPAFIRNFKGRLGVIKNSSYANYATMNFPDAIIETFDSWNATVDALFEGKVLAIYRDEGEVQIITKTRENASILMKPVYINDKRDPIAMAVSPDAPLLQEWLNLFLDEYLLQNRHELTVASLVERHFVGVE
jgi:ABC-type amino acid transport substrate-binding protein